MLADIETIMDDGRDFDRLLLDQIADRWSILVLGAICAAGGGLRFNALKRQIPGMAQKTLTQCLRRLERNGIVERRLIDAAPPGVEYLVTPLGRTLGKPFDALNAWTADYAETVRAAQKSYDARQLGA
jgi:DNA-binding HxlR family transcriptional regulator